MQFDTIDISLHHQEGWLSPTGSESPERFTVDFVVNGESLYSLLDVARYGHASRFAADFRDRNQEAVDVFLMKKPPDIEGRAILYECSLCADSGCGVFLVKITRSVQGYVWSEFGFDQGWGDDQFPQLDLERYKGIGPFTFEAEHYEQTIKRAAESGRREILTPAPHTTGHTDP
jgi:hypothetical protein